jgi:hypothetical protein
MSAIMLLQHEIADGDRIGWVERQLWDPFWRQEDHLRATILGD